MHKFVLSVRRTRRRRLIIRVRPEQSSDEVGGLSGQWIGWVGVDARRGHLGVPKDVLNHVDVYVQLAEQRSCRVASVVQPHVLNSGLAEDCLPFLPIDVRVDRVTVRLAPNQIPVLPGVAGGVALGSLCLQVRVQCGDKRRG